ncbi:phosphodiesterase [Actinomadura rubrobrunea]|uniref:Phosphodiesterase n=1 Tax=Actinomadura rubrobrunea TaxID=115335 RepID=A0A9W6Q199_9ACTN|nr:nucleotide pyrophosphatase/phosphodiesterase family protein [Actinomadura rubrobrunea]GLW66696.1 phosphodiesterase [Actinomadura rubrobrunea]
MTAGLPAAPRYGSGALADLPTSALAALGVPGAANVLGLPERPRVCVLLVDGLGWELLREHAQDAPFLGSLIPEGRSLTAGFPATTATSLASLGTGLPPGAHGLVGIAFAVPGVNGLLQCLKWRVEDADPVVVQPRPTAYERAAAAGVSVSYVASGAYRGSGLSLATARGADYLAADTLGQLVAQAENALRADRAYVTVYHPDLDSTGHVFGAGSPHWRHQLRFVDLLAERLAEALPPGASLYVTADHGMINPSERVDVDEMPALRAGVARLGGEARARHVYAEPGAAGDVLAAWRETLGGKAWVLSREEAVDAGWFGPVDPAVLPRVGDVVAVPDGDLAIIASRAEPVPSRLVGMHGSLLPAEQLVPLLAVHRG